jgi:hypothetical protein
MAIQQRTHRLGVCACAMMHYLLAPLAAAASAATRCRPLSPRTRSPPPPTRPAVVAENHHCRRRARLCTPAAPPQVAPPPPPEVPACTYRCRSRTAAPVLPRWCLSAAHAGRGHLGTQRFHEKKHPRRRSAPPPQTGAARCRPAAASPTAQAQAPPRPRLVQVSPSRESGSMKILP